MAADMAELVMGAAKARNDPPVERRFIELAIAKIATGQASVDTRYPSGAPSLRGVYQIAAHLAAEEQAKKG